MRSLVLVCLVACSDKNVVIRAGSASLTIDELKTKYQTSSLRGQAATLDELKAFARRSIEDRVLCDEAKRTHFKPTQISEEALANMSEDKREATIGALMRDQIAAELKTALKAEDLHDDELVPIYGGNSMYPYYPRRVSTVLAVFEKQSDAARFAAEAKGKTLTTEQFLGIYRTAVKRLLSPGKTPPVETWDADLSEQPQKQWPVEVVKFAFTGKEGDVLGPVTGTSDRYTGPRSYVIYVVRVLPETNSFEQLKPRLREMAMMRKITTDTEKRVADLVDKIAVFNDVALFELKKQIAAPAQ